MIAFVRGVIALASCATSSSAVSRRTSTNTGFAPICEIASAVAINVFATVITSSPGPMPSPRSTTSIASVPFAHDATRSHSQNFANAASNSRTAGPPTNAQLSITDWIAGSTSALIDAYCACKSTRGSLAMTAYLSRLRADRAAHETVELGDVALDVRFAAFDQPLLASERVEHGDEVLAITRPIEVDAVGKPLVLEQVVVRGIARNHHAAAREQCLVDRTTDARIRLAAQHVVGERVDLRDVVLFAPEDDAAIVAGKSLELGLHPGPIRAANEQQASLRRA